MNRDRPIKGVPSRAAQLLQCNLCMMCGGEKQWFRSVCRRPSCRKHDIWDERRTPDLKTKVTIKTLRAAEPRDREYHIPTTEGDLQCLSKKARAIIRLQWLNWYRAYHARKGDAPQ